VGDRGAIRVLERGDQHDVGGAGGSGPSSHGCRTGTASPGSVCSSIPAAPSANSRPDSSSPRATAGEEDQPRVHGPYIGQEAWLTGAARSPRLGLEHREHTLRAAAHLHGRSGSEPDQEEAGFRGAGARRRPGRRR
jgi:hypothetical protein